MIDLYSDFPELDEDAKRQIAETEAAGLKLREKILSVFDSDDGRIVANYIIYELCGVNRSVFSHNPLEMARSAGAQEVGLLLKQILENKNNG